MAYIIISNGVFANKTVSLTLVTPYRILCWNLRTFFYIHSYLQTYLHSYLFEGGQTLIVKYWGADKIDPVFVKKINQFKFLSREEMRELFKKFRKNAGIASINARNKIVECNLRLVPKMVRKWRTLRTIDQMDLIGTCGEELIKIVENFDEDRGCFENYANKCIGKRIFRALKQSLMIAIPEDKWNDKAIRDKSKVFLEESFASFNLVDSEKGCLSMASFKGKEPSPDLIVMAKDELQKTRNEIKEVLDFIVGCGDVARKKKAEIFKARYGLMDGSLKEKTLNKIANIHNLTTEGTRKVIIRLWANINRRFPQRDERWLEHQIQRFKDMLDFMNDDDVEIFNLKFEN